MQALTPSTAFFYPSSSGLPRPCPFSTESLFPACSVSDFVLGPKDTAVSRADTGSALRFSLSFILTKQRKTEHNKNPSHNASPLSFALLSFSRTSFVLILLTAFPCVHSLLFGFCFHLNNLLTSRLLLFSQLHILDTLAFDTADRCF